MKKKKVIKMKGWIAPIRQYAASEWKHSTGELSNCIEVQPSEQQIYHDLLELSPMNQLKEPAYQSLGEDFYEGLTKLEPYFVPLSALKASAYLNYAFLKLFNQSSTFKKLRQCCVQRPLYGLLATQMLVNLFSQTLSDAKGKALWQQNQNLLQLEQQLHQQQAGIEALQQYQATYPGKKIQEKIEQTQKNIQSLQALYDKRKEEWKNLISKTDLVNDFASQMLDQMEQMETSLTEASELEQTWGLGTGRSERVSMSDKIKMTQRLQSSSKFKQLNRILGRFQDVFSSTTPSRKFMKDTTIRSIELGNQLESILPSDKMKLGHPTFKKDFYQRYLQKQLMQYKKTKNKPQGKGPIVAALDCSASMEGESELWSKAVGLAMLRLAKEQKRTFVGILYSQQIDYVLVAPKGKVDGEDLLEFAERFSRGGTNYKPPLKKAMEFIKEEALKGADILFVSDGIASLDKSFLKHFNDFKQQMNCQCIGVFLISDLKENPVILNQFCDEVVTLDALLELNTPTEQTVAVLNHFLT